MRWQNSQAKRRRVVSRRRRPRQIQLIAHPSPPCVLRTALRPPPSLSSFSRFALFDSAFDRRRRSSCRPPWSLLHDNRVCEKSIPKHHQRCSHLSLLNVQTFPPKTQRKECQPTLYSVKRRGMMGSWHHPSSFLPVRLPFLSRTHGRRASSPLSPSPSSVLTDDHLINSSPLMKRVQQPPKPARPGDHPGRPGRHQFDGCHF